MASHTKILKKLPVDHETLERFRDAMFLRKVTECVKNLEDELAELPTDEDIREIIHKSRDLIHIPEKSLVYDAQVACLRPDVSAFDMNLAVNEGEFYKYENDAWKNIKKAEAEKLLKLNGVQADLPTYSEVLKAFRFWMGKNLETMGDDNWSGVVFADGDVWKNYSLVQKAVMQGRQTDDSFFAMIPFLRLNGVDSEPVGGIDAILLLLKNDLVPKDVYLIDKEQVAAYNKIRKGIAKKYPDLLHVEDGRIVIDKQKIISDLRNGKTYDFIDFDAQSLLKTTELSADETFLHDIANEYMACDERRAALDPYDDRMLTDPNRGHWDLWDDPDEVPEGGGMADLGEGLVARDPAADVADGFIAIDFGTKSTVVAYESGPETYRPLQVGSGVYSNGVFETNYENPTIVHFLDIPAFEDAYAARPGRPATRWETMTVSHAAKQDLDTNKASAHYNEFFEGLKHWCGTKDMRVKIRDAAGNNLDLPPFMDLADADFNPVEVYAYYIGLYMNNMLTGHCYLHYLMSFPVTYETDVREKIRSSFEKGLRKSLPTALLANEAAMQEFFVQEGTNEPAAYAITALREFGFTPEDGKQSYYAVFDFGGGTTDFDYGMLGEPPEDDERHSARLTHFGASGDRTLGGENLLRLLAFEVFKANRDFLLHPTQPGSDANADVAKINFTWPAEQRPFKGYEALIKASQEAHQNMHNLMEALRPVWQAPTSEAAKDILQKGFVQVNLFNEKGEERAGVQLKLKPSETAEALDLTNILRQRIEKGVITFFAAMKEAFATASKESSPVKTLAEVGDIAIFLAGNASRSPLVTELFEELIGKPEDSESVAKDEKAVAEVAKKNANSQKRLRDLLGFDADDALPQFHLFPPLGTPEAAALVKVQHDLDDEPPTAKTGVAYGLLASRDGEETEVLDLTSGGDVVPFLYYIGRKRRGKFLTVLGMDAMMQDWVPFIDAGGDVDLLYTDKAEAARNDVLAKNLGAKSVHIRIDAAHRDKQKTVYIRPVAPRAIEYTIAASIADIGDADKHPEEPIRIELE